MELRILPTSYFKYNKDNNSFNAEATSPGVRINKDVEYIKLRNNKTKKYILFQKHHTCKNCYYYKPTIDNQDQVLTERQKEMLIVIEKPKFYNL